jgi:hypothetical protein
MAAPFIAVVVAVVAVVVVVVAVAVAAIPTAVVAVVVTTAAVARTPVRWRRMPPMGRMATTKGGEDGDNNVGEDCDNEGRGGRPRVGGGRLGWCGWR